jgi:hypothetical protein
MVCVRMNRAMKTLALLSLATAAFAQPKPETVYKAPAEVEAALRNRVTEFYQLHVEGNFRKAYTMVAEDTQDYYFGAGKQKYESFRITGIKFLNDNFTKATVDLEAIQKIMKVEFQGLPVAMPQTTQWKIENGLWVWYRDPDNPQITPMGLSDIDKIRTGKATPEDLQKLTSPGEIQRKAQEILKQSGVDKSEVTLPSDKPSSEVIKFHNGWPGYVTLVASENTVMGLALTLDKKELKPGEDAVLTIRYTPDPAQRPPSLAQVRLLVAPFNIIVPVIVKFGAPVAANH